MAFNNLGPVFTLAPHETVGWTYSYALADAGAQFAAPDVKNRGGRLVAFNQAKRILPNGRVIYSVDIRNDGEVAIDHNLQGGGFRGGFNNAADVVTLAPFGEAKYLFRFGGPLSVPEDRGAQFFGADIKTHDCEVVAVIQGKEIGHGFGVRYSASFRNNGPAIAAFNFQGGGLDAPAFNNAGDLVTIAPKETQLYHFFFGLAREDRGAQYASADVHTLDAELVAVSHGKEISGVIGIDYYVTIRNDGPVTAAYNIQGGSLI